MSQGDTPSNASAAAGAAAPTEAAQTSAVDFSDLDAEQEAESRKAEEAGDDEDDESTNSRDGDDDDADEDEGNDEDADDEEDSGDADEDDDEQEDDDDRPRKKSRSQRYQDQIRRLQDENSQLRGRSAGNLTDEQVAAKVKTIIGEPPQEKDFDDYLAFDRAAQAYEVDKRQVTREVKAEAGRATEADNFRKQQRAEQHNDRVADFRTRGATPDEKKANAADFDKVMAAAKNAKVAPVVEELILDSKKGAHLQYYLAKNPDRLAALNRMSERDAAREIGRIEARLALPKPKTKSSAPPPPRRPQGGSAPASADAELEGYLTKKYGKQR